MGLLSFFPRRRHRHTSTPTPLHMSLYTRSIKTCPQSSTPPTSKLHREIPLYPQVLKMLWEKPRFSRGVGGPSLQRKKGQRAGRLHFPLREENTRQKPPHKTKGLREFYRFWGVQLHISRCACICLSSLCLRQGWEGPTPGPTLPWGPPQRGGPVASNPSFWWPDTTWAQFKSTASRILG